MLLLVAIEEDFFISSYSMDTTKSSLLFALVLLVVLTTINPVYPNEQLLQHLGTLLLFGGLVWDIRAGHLSFLAYFGIVIFTLLHIIGARWIYSYVPYRECLELLGLDLGEGVGRNHYDRLVHFAFGLMLLPACYELLRLKFGKSLWLLLVAWCVIQVGSLVYELFEWGLAVMLSPQASENYNGQQGDMWDAQKDMTLALLGSSLTTILYYLRRGRVRWAK